MYRECHFPLIFNGQESHLTSVPAAMEPVAVSGESGQKRLDWVTGVSNGRALVLVFEMTVLSGV